LFSWKEALTGAYVQDDTNTNTDILIRNPNIGLLADATFSDRHGTFRFGTLMLRVGTP